MEKRIKQKKRGLGSMRVVSFANSLYASVLGAVLVADIWSKSYGWAAIMGVIILINALFDSGRQ